MADIKANSEKLNVDHTAQPTQQKNQQTYYAWLREGAGNQYENWKPWLEDQYLRWFTRDNKASYATRDTLNKTKITGNPQLDNLQDGVHDTAAAQFGQDGLLKPVGDLASQHGVNRAERGGKDAKGTYAGAGSDVVDPVVDSVRSGGQGLMGGVQKAGDWVGRK